MFFAVSCFYLKLEVAAQFMCITMLNLCLIIQTKPYLEQKQYQTELFNETIALVVFTLLQSFKPDFLRPEDQYLCGWVCTAVIGFFMVVHLSFNFIPKISSCK